MQAAWKGEEAVAGRQEAGPEPSPAPAREPPSGPAPAAEPRPDVKIEPAADDGPPGALSAQAADVWGGSHGGQCCCG